jgi:tetratricopeptide (TPR) repeat protein
MGSSQTSSLVAVPEPLRRLGHPSDRLTIALRISESSESLTTAIQRLLTEEREGTDEEILSLGKRLLNQITSSDFSEFAPVLIRVCSHNFKIGRSNDAIEMGSKLAEIAAQSDNIHIRRKIYNVLGAHYVDISDFTAAMQCLQTALSLAKEIGDEVIKAACLANVATLMQEMGHYQQAIMLTKEVLKLDCNSDGARGLKIQCSATGLFAAHRIGDGEAARYFLSQGQEHLAFAFGDLGRAFFEKDRALYLIDCGQGREAKRYIEKAFEDLDTSSNVRVRVLLSISSIDQIL